MDLFTPVQVEKLTKLAARLGSPFDGEALAAARLLNKELEKADLTWRQVFNLDRNKPSPVLTGSNGGKIYFKARWRSAIRELRVLARLGKIEGREADFILSLNDEREPTENQHRFIAYIFRKYSGKSARCEA